jgi:uncharacterized Zn finger protein
MPCTPDHYIDHDPCPKCGSTHTEGVEGTATVNRCLNCGEVFDVASEAYETFAQGE